MASFASDGFVLDVLFERVPARRYPKGWRLFADGAPCDGLWRVRSGSVAIYKASGDGRMMILEVARAGDVVGLVEAVDGREHPSDAETREDSSLAFIGRAAFLAAAHAVPDLGLEIAQACAERVRRMTGQIAAATLYGVKERLAAYLVDAAGERGVRGPDGSVNFDLDAPQQEIARRLGTAREVVARSLRELAARGWISRSGGHVKIKDLAALRCAAVP